MGEPIEIHSRAAENLRYIRSTMESATRFTAVPGYGGMAMGAVGAAAALTAAARPADWLIVWLAAGMVAVAVGALAVLKKAQRSNVALDAPPARKFAAAFAPPVVAGGVLTAALLQAGKPELIPGVWLLLYGTGVVTGGAYSPPVVVAMGITFQSLGVAALFAPAAWGNWILGAGFGVVHLGFGYLIARKHGG
jgi:hypothetical protein